MITMSFPSEAHDFVIEHAEFLEQNVTLIQYGPSGIDILCEASSPGAALDSSQQSSRRCFPGTREQYIADIISWASNSNEASPPMCWMRGPAGVGKSSVAQSCAEYLNRSGYLGAAFFFSVKKCDDPAHYRAIIDKKILKDKTLVLKTISAQFRSLILEPLQELERHGRGVVRKVVFIDGLDECANEGSQVEIIDIIASSIRMTPLRWAFFSRPETHLVAAFESQPISSDCYSIFLPISRKADDEIELYLRGGFQNILRRRACLHLASSWPTKKDIQRLVDAAAGLFAHPATLLRFIDSHSSLGFEETLESILNSLGQPSTLPASPYTELDALYTEIMRRVPTDVLPPMCLFLGHLVGEYSGEDDFWLIATICNILASMKHLEIPLEMRILIYGNIHFYHKSFYDFLVDPARSSAFCVTASAMKGKLFDHYIQQHFHYASSYEVQGASIRISSLSSLSWPCGHEYLNSFIMLHAFVHASMPLSLNSPAFSGLVENFPSDTLRKLEHLDFRRNLIADIDYWNITASKYADVVGHTGTARVFQHTAYECLRESRFAPFEPKEFLAMVDKLEKAGVIRPFHPDLGSSRAASILHTLSRQKSLQKSSGQYKLGHGERSVVWYWEFDVHARYFHEFRTIDYAEAIKIYKAEKFSMWEEPGVPPTA
ncbi:hypothetical protein NP233_g12363 [Leucocoprinus birnbaumii]|uniref:Nephrocystin 3-like N-terminal domain-containing protein n=1 Tax=Leucocoprinus birnbaumii TaxID=56174 RepID=A0AAD5VH55_9AGAR|nr:hypothetical protein NP233_g12363 [Leucocoprinus birnbaumii]